MLNDRGMSVSISSQQWDEIEFVPVCLFLRGLAETQLRTNIPRNHIPFRRVNRRAVRLQIHMDSSIPYEPVEWGRRASRRKERGSFRANERLGHSGS